MKIPDKLIIELYRAAQEMHVEEFQQFSTGLIKALLKFDSSRYAAGEVTPQGLSTHSFFLHNEAEESIGDYAAITHADPILKAGFANPNTIIRFHSPTLYRDKKNLALLDYTQRHKHANGMTRITTSVGSSELQIISVFRADEDCHFSDQDCKLASLVFPHFLEASKINRALAIRQCIDEVECNLTAIAGLNGALHYSGSGFRKVLCDEWVGWKGAYLPESLLHELGHNESARYTTGRVCITSRRIGKLIFLRATKSASTVSRLTVHPQVLQSTCGLTFAEARVAIALLDCESAKSVAEKLGVSPHTVRTQIKEAYAKLEVNNRAGFMKKMLELAPK